MCCREIKLKVSNSINLFYGYPNETKVSVSFPCVGARKILINKDWESGHLQKTCSFYFKSSAPHHLSAANICFHIRYSYKSKAENKF